MRLILLKILLLLIPVASFSQVRIRLFANKQSGSALFTVTEGKYEMDLYDGNPITLTKDDPVIFAFYEGKVAVKTKNLRSFSCDSLFVRGMTGKDGFSLKITGTPSAKQMYSGDLQCLPDMGRLILINICDIEQYVAGVVKAEGGPGWKIEYFKSQALLVRSYIYKYFNRHTLDRYNLCDNTHCQAFYGITTDSVIIKAALATKGMVVLDHDSVLITSAFHSNCGGETSVSEDVWLAGYPYLKKVIDPYCTSSRNAKWSKTMTLEKWREYINKCGYSSGSSDPSVYNFSQITRLPDYRVGSFSLPFTRVRNDLSLRSAFFSVLVNGDSVTLKGRGFGHGVGLCQEGAMEMASRGFNFRQIIDFYFSEVIITDVKNVKKEINNF
ncbi:MAG: SpoIID/LytB domain-containing protein [Bacteroidales bacterium]